MGTEIAMRETTVYSSPPPSPSSYDRPFKIMVGEQTFLIDSESMRKVSPIFSVMCYGKDFENGRELSREIVDEKSNDIDIFLRAVHDSSVINATNFATVLRLSHKYQVNTVIDACENYVKRQDLDVLKADQILTLIIASFDHQASREVMVKLIRRMAAEPNSVFTKLKISRYLPAQIYGAIISTSMNLSQLREYEAMNGHSMRLERSKIRWRSSLCASCKKLCDQCATCDQCHKTYCQQHIREIACPSDYGIKQLLKIKDNIVELDWNH